MKAAQKMMNSIRILAVLLTGFWAVALAQEAAHVPPNAINLAPYLLMSTAVQA
jgi:hypothetical protein